MTVENECISSVQEKVLTETEKKLSPVSKFLYGFLILFLSLRCLGTKKSPFDSNSPDGLLRSLIASLFSVPVPETVPLISPAVLTLTYSASSFLLPQNVPFTLTPALSRTVTGCTVSPSLPAGLSIDNRTCTISGTPTVTQTASSYSITAVNSVARTSATIAIAVNEALSFSWGLFTDMVDGTVRMEVNAGTFGGQTYSAQTLYFMKCSQGYTWNSATNGCTGTYGGYTYCNSNDNSCNSDGTGNPPWTLNGTGTSGAYATCNSLNFAGKTGWRVPTLNELKLLIMCNDNIMPSTACGVGNYPSPSTNSLFPNTDGYYYWSSTYQALGGAWHVNFNGGSVAPSTKTNGHHVRCVYGP